MTKNTSGFTLVGALVGMVVTLVSGLALLAFFQGIHRWQAFQAHRSSGEKVLVAVAQSILSGPYANALGLCYTGSSAQSGTFKSSNTPGNCTLNGSAPLTLNTNSNQVDCTLQSNKGKLLEVRVDWTGDCVSMGPVCTEVVQCNQFFGSRILELTLAGYWPAPDPNQPVVTRYFTVRKSIW